MKNLQTLLFLVMLLAGVSLQAQQTLCTRQAETYIVDESDASADGSYEWNLVDASGNELPSLINNGTTNEVTVDWDNSTVDSYTLPHTFKLQVVETVNGCSAEPQTIEITLIKGYESPAITAPSGPVCTGNADNKFLLTGGTNNAYVGYTITSDNIGFTEITGFVPLDATGSASIDYPELTDPSAAETFTLTLTSIDDVEDPSSTSGDACGSKDLTGDNITQSVTINPIPVTSEITPK
ncbi:MAG: hypothetical protein ACR2MS_07130 [Weeksellaceae bacterium]